MRALRYVTCSVLLAALAVLYSPSLHANETDKALSSTDTCVSLDVSDEGAGTWEVTGTWAGTITFYVVGRGGTQGGIDAATADAPSTAVNTTTGNGLWGGSVAGYQLMRACWTTVTSGAPRVWLKSSNSGGGSGGGGGGGAGTSDTLEATQIEVRDNLAQIEGFTDGIEGILTTIDADTGSILTSVQLIDNAISGAGFNITQFGGAAVPIGAGVEATAVRVTLPTDGTGVVGITGAALTSIQAIETAVEATLTVEIDPASLSDPAVHGNAVATAPDGIPFMCEAKDIDGGALPNVVTEGQFSRPTCVLNGVQAFVLTNEAGSSDIGASMLVALANIDDWYGTEDDPILNARGLAMVGFERRDVAASSAGSTGENATGGTDALGLLWTRSLDPCSGVAKSYLPISIVTATTTEITAALAGASTHYYICSLNLVTDAANDVLVADDDSDNCASPTSGIFGSDGSPAASEGWNFAAGSGIALGSGISSVGRTQGTNRVICVITSAATQLSGMLVVAAAP